MMLRMTSLATLAAAMAFTANPGLAVNPYAKADESWISLTGTVASAADETFTLDYGDGLITVEMDEWEWYEDDTLRIMPGEKVTVYGRIDDGFYQMRTIEAGSVYSFDRATYYYASSADEESDPIYYYTTPTLAPEGSWVSMTGTVTEKSGREFTLDTGWREISVDTASMLYNPLDDQGMQQISIGDRVSVSGQIDDALFDERELSAELIVSLADETG
ncbi:MAG: hypothetical protein Tsb0016_02380 [Sphingomonadales bacterium]